MYKMLLSSALRKGYEKNITALAKVLGVENTFNVDKIDEEIDRLVKNYTDTHTYILAAILKLCFKNEFDEILRSSQDTLCLLVYRNKKKIEDNFKKLKNKWREAKEEIGNSRVKILSRELRELEFLLKLDEEEFKKLLTVFSLIGEIVGEIYNDLKETAEKKEKDWEELDVEEIKGVVDLSKEEKKVSLTELLAILGILGTSLAAVLVIGWTVKKNFGFLDFFGQAEVKSIGNDTKSEGNNTGTTQQEIEKSKRISQEEGGKFLENKNVTDSNSTANAIKRSSNKTSIGKEENGISKVHPKAGIQRDKEGGKEPTKGNNKGSIRNTETRKGE
jgi:hypothetical protein